MVTRIDGSMKPTFIIAILSMMLNQFFRIVFAHVWGIRSPWAAARSTLPDGKDTCAPEAMLPPRRQRCFPKW